MKRIPFILVTGFLGSGKTSLLMNLVHNYSTRLRIAIVQNEFAPGHVDGSTLKQSGETFELLEINNGSVFCACLLGDFISRLSPFIQEHQPDLILLEATGLADPISLGQILQAPELADKIYLAGSWCLVDALNFLRIINTVTRVSHQVRIADIVWINKTDLVRDTAKIRAKIFDLNPFVQIRETTYGAIGQLDLTKSFFFPKKNGIPFLYSGSVQRPQIGSCVIRANRFFDLNAVSVFMREQSQELYRIKGFVRINQEETLAVQAVFDGIQTTLIKNYGGPTEIIALGPSLDKRVFSKQFLALQVNK